MCSVLKLFDLNIFFNAIIIIIIITHFSSLPGKQQINLGVLNGPFAPWRHYYVYEKNPSGFCFLVQIRAFVI